MVINVCFCYSTGLPFLYPIMTLYFFTSYYFNKVMLLRFYQKTFEFNENLPQNSTKWIQLAIVLHSLFAIIQMMSQDVFDYGEERTEHLSFANSIEELEDQNKGISVHQAIVIAYMTLMILFVAVDSWLYPFSQSLVERFLNMIRKEKPLKGAKNDVDDTQDLQNLNHTETSNVEGVDAQNQGLRRMSTLMEY